MRKHVAVSSTYVNVLETSLLLFTWNAAWMFMDGHTVRASTLGFLVSLTAAVVVTVMALVRLMTALLRRRRIRRIDHDGWRITSAGGPFRTSLDAGFDFRTGDRVYVRRRDLVGQIVERQGTVFVKWEWPIDPEAPPEEVPINELERVRWQSDVP